MAVKGAKIFNLLPIWIRTLNGVTVDSFKSELDMFLSGVPDHCAGQAESCSNKQFAGSTPADLLNLVDFVVDNNS